MIHRAAVDRRPRGRADSLRPAVDQSIAGADDVILGSQQWKADGKALTASDTARLRLQDTHDAPKTLSQPRRTLRVALTAPSCTPGTGHVDLNRRRASTSNSDLGGLVSQDDTTDRQNGSSHGEGTGSGGRTSAFAATGQRRVDRSATAVDGFILAVTPEGDGDGRVQWLFAWVDAVWPGWSTVRRAERGHGEGCYDRRRTVAAEESAEGVELEPRRDGE